jgi:hypothetical protein
MMPSNLLDLFFPTPRHVIVAWRDGYGVGDRLDLPPGVGPLPLQMRLADLNGISIRWRIGVREGLAIWAGSQGFLIPRSAGLRSEQELALPGSLRLFYEEGIWGARLVLSGPAVPGERQEFPLERLERIVLALQKDPPAVWAAGVYRTGGMSSGFAVRTISPSPEGTAELRLPFPWEIRAEAAGGFLALFDRSELWAGRMDRGALPRVLQERARGLAAAAFSPRGQWMAALWDRLPEKGVAGWSIWRWTRGAFRLEREEEMPELPEPGWAARIAPGLDWAVRVGNRVWGIAGLPNPSPPGAGRSREAVRRIFPVPFEGRAPRGPGDSEQEGAR